MADCIFGQDERLLGEMTREHKLSQTIELNNSLEGELNKNNKICDTAKPFCCLNMRHICFGVEGIWLYYTDNHGREDEGLQVLDTHGQVFEKSMC